jgi:hypothetical protein
MQLVIFLPIFNIPYICLKIWCDGWKRKYFGFAWEVNTCLVKYVSSDAARSSHAERAAPVTEHWRKTLYMDAGSVEHEHGCLPHQTRLWGRTPPNRWRRAGEMAWTHHVQRAHPEGSARPDTDSDRRRACPSRGRVPDCRFPFTKVSRGSARGP